MNTWFRIYTTFQKFGVGKICIFILKEINTSIQQAMHVKNDHKAVLWNILLIKESWFPQKY